MIDSRNDRRIILTFDAGGTRFRFSAIWGNESVTGTLTVPSYGDDSDRCLTNIVEGVGVWRLGTSEATAIGAYAYALHKLDQLSGLR